MIGPLNVSQDTSLLLAVMIGFFFGLFLERGGLGNPHKLTGVFYLTDFAVPKVMFTMKYSIHRKKPVSAMWMGRFFTSVKMTNRKP